MRYIGACFVILAVCMAAAGFAQTVAAPATSASIMEKAYRQAKSEKKPVLLLFGATW